MTENADQKQRHGFRKGQSGNPKGKPPGTRNVALRALDAIGERAAQDLLRTVIAKAAEGDMQAARILLDRVWPARKGRRVTFTLPPVETAVDVHKAVAAILKATASGQITIEEGQGLAAILETQRRTLELGELERRLSALESTHEDA